MVDAPRCDNQTSPTLYTIGHSNRSLAEFLELLQAHGIRRVIDIRRFPVSRKFPHFSGPELAEALRAVGVAYEHWPELGGRRSRRDPDSPNTAWRVAGFNAYADHLRDHTVQQKLRTLIETSSVPTALMCAEAVPWRCHRQIVADQLVAWGATVLHIVGPSQCRSHRLSPLARVTQDGAVIYPGQPELPLQGDPVQGENESRQLVELNDHEVSCDGATIVPDPAWQGVLSTLEGATTIVIGQPAAGKSTFVRWAAERLAGEMMRVAIVTADVGQPLFGPPGALWASVLGDPTWQRGWFVGDNSPVGNLVPVLTGATALVRAVRAHGAHTVLIDTTGLVDGPVGRLLKLHKALCTEASVAVLFGDDPAIRQIEDLLRTAGVRCLRLERSPYARQRDWAERRAFREQRFQEYFAGSELRVFPSEAFITPNWEAGLSPTAARVAHGRLCGLLDEAFYCLGLGIVEAPTSNGLFVRTPVAVEQVRHVAMGKLKLDPSGREQGKLR